MEVAATITGFARTAAYSYDNDPSVRITRGLSKTAETNADLLAVADNAQHVADAVQNKALGPMAAWATSDYTQFGATAMMLTAQTVGARTHPAKAIPGSAGAPPETEPLDPLELERAIAELPTAQQVVIRMRYYLGLSLAQISRNLSISSNTAASRCRYALAALRKALSGPRHSVGAGKEEDHGNG